MSQTQTRRSAANRTVAPAASSPRHSTARLAELPPTLTIEEAGDMLGISRRSAYRAAARGELPTLRLGRRLLVPTPRLLALLGLPVHEPTDEPTPAATSPAAAPPSARGSAPPSRCGRRPSETCGDEGQGLPPVRDLPRAARAQSPALPMRQRPVHVVLRR